MSKSGSFASEFAVIARQVGLSVAEIEYCREAGLIEMSATEVDHLAELRRVRHLQMLDVNLEGVEIILRMRRRILALQSEHEALIAQMEGMQTRFEREVEDLQRRLAQDI